jgi:hypothetical protein
LAHERSTSKGFGSAHKKLDIAVDCHEADRSLIILDADEVIFKPTCDGFLQYLKTLETFAIKSARNAIDIMIDISAF